MASKQLPTGVNRLREILKENGEDAGWDKVWEEGVTPWENQNRGKDGVRPPLKEVIQSGEFPVPKSGRALVPGCGRGFDTVYLARLGLEAWGIDLSQTAVDAAEAFLKSQPDPPTNIVFKAADFFKFPIPEGGFSLVYDYTFFCAIPLSLRADWGARITELVPAGGYLIALVWPIDGDRPGGPPYSVDVAAYEQVLGDKWTKVIDRASEASETEMHQGREKIVVWRKRASAGAHPETHGVREGFLGWTKGPIGETLPETSPLVWQPFYFSSSPSWPPCVPGPRPGFGV